MKIIPLPQTQGSASLNIEISTLTKTINCITSPHCHKTIEVPDDAILVVVDAYSAGKQMIAAWGLSFKENDGLWRKFTPELHDIEILRAELAPKPEPEVIPEPEPEVIPGHSFRFAEALQRAQSGNAPEARVPVEAKKKKRKLEEESNSASM
jgi:hypothetical protein